MAIDEAKKHISQISITAPGVLEENLDQDILDSLKLNVSETFTTLSTLDKSKIRHSVELSVRKHIRKLINKSPLINTSIFFI